MDFGSGVLVGRLSCPMLNPFPKSVHFLDYQNFGALFDFFFSGQIVRTCAISIGYKLVNIELAKFV